MNSHARNLFLEMPTNGKGCKEIADWFRLYDSYLVWFFDAWQQLERDGKVDATGGAQFRCVLAEWISEGMPADVTDYILFDADRTLSLVFNAASC